MLYKRKKNYEKIMREQYKAENNKFAYVIKN